MSDHPNLPTEIINHIILLSSDHIYTNVCKNFIISKHIATNNKITFDGSGDIDQFFDYHAKKYTIAQLKNPTSDREIVFVKQLTAMIDHTLKVHVHRLFCFDYDSKRNTRWIRLWIYKMIRDFIRDSNNDLNIFFDDDLISDLETNINILITQKNEPVLNEFVDAILDGF